MARSSFVSLTVLLLVFSTAAIAAQPVALQSYGSMPLSFEKNGGQTDPAVRYLARGQGYALFLTDREAVLRLHSRSLKASTRDSVVRVGLARANTHPRVAGADVQPNTSNYFRGSDPAKWRTRVPNYAKVRYSDVYDGIDLVYHGNQRQLEYDFEVAPGADPRQIELVVTGAGRLTIDEGGNLVLDTPAGPIVQHKPVAYQDIDGVRHPIDVAYVLQGRNRATFRIASFDAEQPLVIDPVLSYSSYLGGTLDDFPTAVAVDDNGAAYIIGYTYSADFPVTTGAWRPVFSSPNYWDGFVMKLGAGGSGPVYASFLAHCDPTAIVVDSAGYAFIAGSTGSSLFPTTVGAYQRTLNVMDDAFVLKLNPAGDGIAFSTLLGGTGMDTATALAVDASGNPYITGNADCDHGPMLRNYFPTTPGAYKQAFNACDAIYIAKFNNTGSTLMYSTFLGEGGASGGKAIAVDASGNVYVAGGASTGAGVTYPVPTTTGAFQTAGGSGSRTSVFVSKLNSDGSALLLSTYLGGSNPYVTSSLDEVAHGIAVDSTGIYVAGDEGSQDFPTTTGAFQPAGGAIGGFITKLKPDFSGLIYSTLLRSTLQADPATSIKALAVDSAGNAYVTGNTGAYHFPLVAAFQSTIGNVQDAFVAKLNATGSAMVYSSYLGGNLADTGYGIAVDRDGNAYVVGQTYSNDFPMKNAFQGTYKGTTGSVNGDGFVTKISPVPLITVTSSVNPSDPGQSVTFTATFTQANSPTGVVLFLDGPDPMGTAATVSGGAATYTTSSLTTGSHAISAMYWGDANNAASTQGNLTQKVRYGTTTAVVSSLNPSNTGDAVTLTATVTPTTSGGPAPTGTVQFMDGSAFLFNPATLVNGSAAITITNWTFAATHSITAVYSGDSDNATSVSNALVQTVNGSGTVTITSVLPKTGIVSGGTNVTIAGTRFQGASLMLPASVKFGGTPATNVVVVNDTHITATTPAHAAGDVDVTVTNSSLESATRVLAFKYQTVPNGDANGNGTIDTADIFYLINHLFVNGGAPVAGDSNGDGIVTAGDIFYLINYLFAGGPPPK